MSCGRICPAVSSLAPVDDTPAPVSITTPDHLKSPSPIANRLRPRLTPK